MSLAWCSSSCSTWRAAKSSQATRRWEARARCAADPGWLQRGCTGGSAGLISGWDLSRPVNTPDPSFQSTIDPPSLLPCCSPSSRAWCRGWPPCSSQSSPSTCSRWVGLATWLPGLQLAAGPHRLGAGGALGTEPLFLLGVHRMPAAAAREWQAQPPLLAVATTVQAYPPFTHPPTPCPAPVLQRGAQVAAQAGGRHGG